MIFLETPGGVGDGGRGSNPIDAANLIYKPSNSHVSKENILKIHTFHPINNPNPNSVSSRPVPFISRTSPRIFPPVGHGHSRYLFHGRGVGPELEFFLEGCNRNTVRAGVGGGEMI